MLGAVEECVANFRQLRERGRSLRASNSLQTFWTATKREQLSDPLMPVFFEASGMMDYWRKHGGPDGCRVDGVTIECDSS
jgi:hypothetical protein